MASTMSQIYMRSTEEGVQGWCRAVQRLLLKTFVTSSSLYHLTGTNFPAGCSNNLVITDLSEACIKLLTTKP